MPRAIEFSVTGFSELQDKLENLPIKASRRILRYALLAAVEVWRRIMEGIVRRGPHHYKGGEQAFGVLAASIVTSARVTSDLEGSAYVGPSQKAFWARFVEFGTSTRFRVHGRLAKALGLKSRPNGGNVMPSFPFIRPAFDSGKQDVLDEFAIECKAALDAEGLTLS